MSERTPDETLELVLELYVEILNAAGLGSPEERAAFERLGTDDRTRRALAVTRLVKELYTRA